MKKIEPNKALGLFLGSFGVLVLIAIFFTNPAHGKIVNAICGILLVLSGYVLSRSRSKEKNGNL